MNHLALLTYSYPPETGGVQIYLQQIVQHLATPQLTITVVTPITGDAVAADGINRLVVSGSNATYFVAALRKLQPTHIIVGHVHPQLLLAAALYRRAHTVCIAHGNDYLAAQLRWHRPITNWLMRRVDQMVTTNHVNATRLSNFGVKNSLIVTPGTDTARFSPPVKRSQSPLTLLTVARLVPRKGVDKVIRAMQQLRTEFPDLQYWVVGDGPDRDRLIALAADCIVAENVRFFGRISDHQLVECYQQAHLFVMISSEEPAAGSMEGFGIVYLEAAACGLPVVVGDSGGASTALKAGENGLLVDPHDADAITTTLRKLLADAALREQLGNAGAAWVKADMSWTQSAQQMAAALRLEPATA